MDPLAVNQMEMAVHNSDALWYLYAMYSSGGGVVAWTLVGVDLMGHRIDVEDPLFHPRGASMIVVFECRVSGTYGIWMMKMLLETVRYRVRPREMRMGSYRHAREPGQTTE